MSKPPKNRIKQLRVAANLTQESLGDLINIDQSIISRIETGHKYPSEQALAAMSNVFHRPVSYILGTSEDKGGNAPEPSEIAEKIPPYGAILTSADVVPLVEKLHAPYLWNAKFLLEVLLAVQEQDDNGKSAESSL